MDLVNTENLPDEVKDPPPILSPVIREVFHVFANMVSFLCLKPTVFS